MKISITGDKGFIGSYLKEYFKDIVSIEEADIAIHCLGRVPKDDVKAKDFVESNIVKAIELVEKFKGKKIVYLSSMSIYDTTLYGVSKLMGELCISEFNGEVVILRIPKIVDKDVPAAFIVQNNIHVAVTKPMGLVNLAEYIKGVL